MPETEITQALSLYNQAQRAEQEGKAELAEVYYLKSLAIYEQRADHQYFMNAAHTLNALAYLRRSRGNFEGAFACVQKAIKLIEANPRAFTNAEAELIRMQAWDLVKNLLLLQEPQQKFSPAV